MPRGNRTGPEGMGPMTGRAAGLCAGNNAPGYAGNVGFGRRMGGGRGRGQGFGFRAAASVALTSEQQIESLKAQAAGLELQLKAINEQIGKLDAE
ncbi:MAG: DUF5320 domain-containing protein [Verrucomicrobiota bacterium]